VFPNAQLSAFVPRPDYSAIALLTRLRTQDRPRPFF